MAALAGCLARKIERSSGILSFTYQKAHMVVDLERRIASPKVTRATHDFQVPTDEPQRRVELLHDNLPQDGTITNTFAAVAKPTGELRWRDEQLPPSGRSETQSAST